MPTDDSRSLLDSFRARRRGGEELGLAAFAAAHPQHKLTLKQAWQEHQGRAEELYATTAEPDVEGLCREHPDLASELRRIDGDRQWMDGMYDRLLPPLDGTAAGESE